MAHQRGEIISKFFLQYQLYAWCISDPIMAGTSYVYCLVKFGQPNWDYMYHGYRFRLVPPKNSFLNDFFFKF